MTPHATVPHSESNGFFTTPPPLLAVSSVAPNVPSVAGYTRSMKLYSPIKTYAPRKWSLSGLKGISDATVETHFGLYEGYVKSTNELNERLAELRERRENVGASPAYAELVRRLGFEYNGMRLQIGRAHV